MCCKCQITSSFIDEQGWGRCGFLVIDGPEIAGLQPI